MTTTARVMVRVKCHNPETGYKSEMEFDGKLSPEEYMAILKSIMRQLKVNTLPKEIKPPKLKRDMVGLRVLLMTSIKNGYGEVPAGTCGVVTQYYRGLTVHFDLCDTCGFKFTVSKIPLCDVIFVEE